MRRKLSSQKGAAAVEFAIVLPVLVLLLFGIIEFSVLLYNKAVITNASREGARQGIVFYTDTNGIYAPKSETFIQGVVATYANNYLITFAQPRPSPITLTSASWEHDPPISGDLLTVTVDYTHGYLVLPVAGLGLEAVTVMRME